VYAASMVYSVQCSLFKITCSVNFEISFS
jgi:hypothetical protein